MTTTQVENILNVYSRGTFAEIRSGAGWYSDAHNLALELSPGNPWRGAGVIAALSPLKSWDYNVRMARNAFRTGIATGHTSSNNAIAQSILDGAFPLDVMRGDKTRAFAAAIATNGMTDMVTIDRHAHDIALNKVFTEKTRKIGKVLYREMSESYRIAAREIGFTECQTQAITWVIWRREKGII